MSEPEPSSTTSPDFAPDFDQYREALGPELSAAFIKKGYTSLTAVQRSVLEPGLEGRDLRISSQTGSGKTLAIGFALRDAVSAETLKRSPVARPQALVVVPTRELAKQVMEELGWLYSERRLRIASVTGGSSYRDEHRMLSSSPAIVVGTPGRLLDHLDRGGIESGDVGAVVLDEADRMLDLGFRDELEAILAKLPETRRTHLVSATFARDVAALADRFQKDPKRIEATPLGTANRDIDHIVYLVHQAERVDALINVLLAHPDEQTLVFARTRADVSEIARELLQAGFAAGALSGEMDQHARNRALDAFKRGHMRALIATDVAARGIDVQDIARVIQIDPPSDPDTYTHRSGRTGRAGRKGVSALLVPPAGLRRARSLLDRARVKYRIEPIPTASAIREAQDARWLSELLNASDSDVPARIGKLIEQIVTNGMTERALAQLIVSVRRATGEPRDVSQLLPEPLRSRDQRGPERRERGDDRGRGRDRFEAPRGRGPEPRFSREREPEPRFPRERNSEAPPASWAPGPPDRAPRGPEGGWVPFRVSWGEAHGADARRLVAMLCRRGGVRGSDIGAIRVDRTSSTVEVAATVAKDFERAAAEPDPRDFRVLITPLGAEAPRERFDDAPRAPHKPRAHVPPSQHRGPPSPRDALPPRPFPHRAFPAPAALPQGGDEPGGFEGPKPRAERPFPKSDGARPFAKPRGDRPFANPRGDRPFAKPRGERPFAKPEGARPFAKPHGAPYKKPPVDAAPKKTARRVVVDAPPRRQRTKG